MRGSNHSVGPIDSPNFLTCLYRKHSVLHRMLSGLQRCLKRCTKGWKITSGLPVTRAPNGGGHRPWRPSVRISTAVARRCKDQSHHFS
jgi:hypothetical protein